MCCFSQKSIKCCSKCLCAASFLLFVAMSAMGVLGVMISKRDILDTFTLKGNLVDSISFIDLSKGSNMVIGVTIACVCLVFLAVLFTWLTKLTMSHTVCCTCLTAVLFLVLALFFLVVGSFLIIPGTLKDGYIDKNCNLAVDD